MDINAESLQPIEAQSLQDGKPISDDQLKQALILNDINTNDEFFFIAVSDVNGNKLEFPFSKNQAYDDSGNFIGEKALLKLAFDSNKIELNKKFAPFISQFKGQILFDILK